MKKWLKKLKNEDGFTLLEMTIVVMVIAILIIVMIPNITKTNSSVNVTTNKALTQTIEAQKILYKAENGKTPKVDELHTEKYITDDQYEAYKENLKSVDNDENPEGG